MSEHCYLIDGYNLLFSLDERGGSFQQQRAAVILSLQQKFAQLGLRGLLVFDGAYRSEEREERSYASPLEIRYTPRGQSADGHIVELLRSSRSKKQWIVVTNDRTIQREARAVGAEVEGTWEFLSSLERRGKKRRKKGKDPRETPAEIERLRKIFEDELNR